MKPHERLEQEWAAFSGRPNVVACNSGTAALHLALESLRAAHGWPDGAEVLVPDFTMVACARAVVLAGLTPVFVDCGDDLLMDCSLLENCWNSYPDTPTNRGLLGNSAFENKVVAVMPVHIYGRRCDMEAVYSFAKPRGIAVVEDCAEFHGGRTGELSDAWCWSFYKNKVVAGEEGGAVAFRDPGAANRARLLRCQGFTPEHDYTHIARGHNYRLADCLADLILHGGCSIEDYPFNLNSRREIVGWYEAECPDEWRMPPRDIHWVYDLRVPNLTRNRQDATVSALRSAGVEARHGFKSLSKQEEFCECRLIPNLGYVKSDAASREVIYLPVRPGVMTEADCRKAFDIIKGVLG